MRLVSIIILLFLGATFTSCTSEYEERLKEGRYLIRKLAIVEQSSHMSNENTLKEIEAIKKEIRILSKISGHEELFLKEIMEN